MIVVVPCYNEAERLERGPVERLLADPRASVLFVDDGSRDETAKVLASLCEGRERASFEVLPKNVGKAEAVRHGLCVAIDADDVIGYADADFATPADEILRLLDRLEESGAEVALGSRIARLGARIERRPARHYLGRIFATTASWVLGGLAVYDTQCGAKLFRVNDALRDALAAPFRSRWSFDVELIGRLMAGGVTPEQMIEEPLRTWVDVDGSKLGLAASAKAGAELIALGGRVRRRGPRGFFPDE